MKALRVTVTVAVSGLALVLLGAPTIKNGATDQPKVGQQSGPIQPSAIGRPTVQAIGRPTLSAPSNLRTTPEATRLGPTVTIRAPAEVRK